MAHLCGSENALNLNAGVLSAMSILIAEQFPGTELPTLVSEPFAQDFLRDMTIQGLPWRAPDTFSVETQRVVRKSLKRNGQWDVFDALLTVGTHPSDIDAYWTGSLLKSLPLAKRDAFWSPYLYDRYERAGIVRRLIDACEDLNVSLLDLAIVDRWVHTLIWFVAAADRRIKDRATRAVVKLFEAHPSIIWPTITYFIATDDDELRERVILCAYGALILSMDRAVLKTIAEALLAEYKRTPGDFQNALIRDHIRSIAELARHEGALDARFDPLLPSKKTKSEWPLTVPSDQEVKQWQDDEELRLLMRSCLNDDFNHYSIGCLRPWDHAMTKDAIGGWIGKRIIEVFGYKGSLCHKYDRETTFRTGGGRSKPQWAERIGKKYQWNALFQLASRMHDNVKPEKSKFDPKLQAVPLILQEERKMDPTLTITVFPERPPSECWWISEGIDLSKTKHLDYATWVKRNNDLPDMRLLCEPRENGGQNWLVLASYPHWNDRPKDAPYETLYRDAWLHLNTFLVRKTMMKRARTALEGRNFFGRWLPDGAKWLHVFIGEYPWATACNMEPDWYLGWNDKLKNASFKLLPTANEVVEEWEYDGSLPRSTYVHVPARLFFEPEPLWWNGRDGFWTKERITVFRDPHLLGGGPQGLIADRNHLLAWLDRMGYCLLWTLLGEKSIIGGNSPNPHVTFSQIASLSADGTIEFSERVFFDDWNKDQGIAETLS